MTRPLYGVAAEFGTPDDLLDAIRKLRADGVRDLEAYTPFPIDGLADALDLKRNCVPLATLIGGVIGGVGGYFMQWYAAVVSFPVNVGGRPLHSWPMFVPVSFELTILCAAFSAVFAMLFANGLPRLHHPIFDVPGFDLASRNRFFLCIRARESDFDASRARKRLERLHALAVHEVAP